MALDGLKLAAARNLSAVVHEEITSDRDKRIRHSERPHLQTLLRQGLIERAPDGQLRLSGEVAFSLGLVDAKTAGLRRQSS